MDRPRFISRNVLSCLLAPLLLGLVAEEASADELQGPGKLIERLNAVEQKPATTAPAKDNYSQWEKDVKAFPQASAGLPAAEAARQWLALVDRYEALKNSSRNDRLNEFYGGASSIVLSALPGPASWPALTGLVEARKADPKDGAVSQCLQQMAVHTLNDKEDQQWTDLAQLATLGDDTTSQGFDAKYLLLTLSDKLSEVATQPVQTEKAWKTAFDLLEKSTGTGFPSPDADVTNVALPDLVTLLGPDKAAPLLLRALTLHNVQIEQVSGTATKQLARKIALAHLDQLGRPPWALTADLDGGPLYEALIKKYPADPSAQQNAIYYVLSLIGDGKPEEAVKAVETSQMSNLSYAIEQAIDHGWSSQIYDFLHSFLPAHPESDLWQSLIETGAQTGHAQEALDLVQKTAAKPGLSAAAKAQIEPILYRALLAVDKVDAGVTQLQLLIKSAKPRLAGNNSMPDSNLHVKALDLNLELARLGNLLKNATWENEGLDGARSAVAAEKKALTFQSLSGYQQDVNSLTTFLMETNRGAEAEKFLIDAIVSAADVKAKADNSQNPNDLPEMAQGFSMENNDPLPKLAFVYYQAGRWSDILDLLQKVSGWQAKDLVEIAGTRPAYGENYPTPCIGLMAARALAETGHPDLAQPILDYVLQIDPGSDAAYALLLKIDPGDIAAKLDGLYARDQFQERPLIWKGELLLQQGKLDEAEKTLKAAILVDPSDGEEGKGDRMRVYSVLADVYDAKHDSRQADFFRNVVKAIRLSEDADDFHEAGLLTRAVAMYDRALGLFSDAYCIQSRLARQLAALGRMDEAAIHYRKAFELMPVSFGRMESHCFGCERAFNGRTAGAIAEKTFKDMLEKEPSKPQLYYLLGYLYMEQDRNAEAVANFHKAAQLDPDYINAWRNIIQVGQDYQLDPNLRDEAVFNVLRLDPAGRHEAPSLDKVRDLVRLWHAEETAAKSITPAPASLYPLAASIRANEKQVDRFEKMLPPGLDADTKARILAQLHAQVRDTTGAGTTPIAAISSNAILTTCLPDQ
jgi:tetratricopeptide (TPR) repeat protein